MDRYNVPKVYAGWSLDDKNRYESTSGGAFSEFAKAVLDEGGVVVGATYNKLNLVEHSVIETYSELYRVKQSKYLSSSIGETYKKIRELLAKDTKVIFCGAPCQVAGLYAYLKDDYDNLLTIDFICRGMNSPKAYISWLKEIENEEHSKATRVWFKYKDGGWKSSPRRTRVDFSDGHYKVFENENNLYMYGYLNTNLYIRPSCGDCNFKGVPRKSDITLADFWGIEKELDDDKGTSMILLNSEKGNSYFEIIKNNLMYQKKDFNEILKGNPMFLESIKISESAHDFLVDLDTIKFSDCLNKYGYAPKKNSLLRKILRKIRLLIISGGK